MAETKATAKALGTGIKLRIGADHVVRLVPPPVPRVRLIGLYFDLYKSFLLPSAIPGIKQIKKQYADHPRSNLLVVGHTDTSGAVDYNLALSLERADAVGAYLKDDVAAWEAFFSHKLDEKRWGTKEIQLMMTALPESGTKFYAGTPSGFVDAKTNSGLKRFQTENGIKPTGNADPETRKALIKAYMDIDAAILPSGITLISHGCGESFPADAIPDGVRSPDDRRVELFFFDGPIDPAPAPDKFSRKGATDYPQWLSLVTATFDFIPTDPTIGPVIGARLPTQFTLGKSFPKPSALSTLKAVKDRMAKDPALKLLLVGHADLKGDPSTNDPLSLSRAKSVRAWLTGDTAFFRERFDKKDPVKKWDWPEVQWMLTALASAGAPCYVGQVDGYPGPATLRALEYFQVQEKLEATGLADEATLKLLIQRYHELLGAPLDPASIDIAGGGEDHPPLPFGTATDLGPAFPDDAPQRFRRVEAFLFAGEVKPPAAGLDKTSESYRTWCRQVEEDITDVSGLTTTIAVVDLDRNPLVGVDVELFQRSGDNPDASVADGKTDALGHITMPLNEGFYSLIAVVGGAELKGSFTVGPDEFGAQVVPLVFNPAA
jgi:outer membrane protein OmpA-like peptidoglycan-associated protein